MVGMKLIEWLYSVDAHPGVGASYWRTLSSLYSPDHA